MVGVVSQEAKMLGEFRESMHGVHHLGSGLADEGEELLKVGVVRERNCFVHPAAKAAVAVHGPPAQQSRDARAGAFEDLRVPQVPRADEQLAAHTPSPSTL